jgi:hypothetical protein
MGQLLLGARAMADSWQRAEYDDARATEMEERVRRDEALATFTRRVARGEDPPTAYVATVRVLAGAGHLVLARAFCEGMAPAVAPELARVARAVCLYRMRRYDVVWDQLARVDPTLLARHALVVAVDTTLSLRTPEATAVARAVVADASYAETSALPRLAGRFLAAGEPDVARRLHDEALTRPARPDRQDPAPATWVTSSRPWPCWGNSRGSSTCAPSGPTAPAPSPKDSSSGSGPSCGSTGGGGCRAAAGLAGLQRGRPDPRAELDPRWNSFPVAESLPDPQLLHYAGAGKPWEDLLIPGGHWWRHHADRFAARATPMPEE